MTSDVKKHYVPRDATYPIERKEQLKLFIEKGWTDKEVCVFFGFSERTLCRWKTKYPDFRKDCEEWKSEADKNVVISMYDMACGYYKPEDKFLVVGSKVRRVRTMRWYPANPTMAIFWITNRQHADWKRTRQEEGTDPLTVKVLTLIKDQRARKTEKNRLKNEDNGIDIQTAVTVEGGGMQIV